MSVFAVSEHPPPLLTGQRSEAVRPLLRSVIPYSEKLKSISVVAPLSLSPRKSTVVLGGYKLLKCSLNKQNIAQLFQRQVS